MLIHFKKIFETKWVVWSLLVIGLVAFIAIIFFSGTVFGNHRADYRCAFGDRYEKMFFGEKGNPMMPGLDKKGDIKAFGASGKIISLASTTMVVAGSDGVEKIISIDANTSIRSMKSTLTLSELKSGQEVVVFGGPDSNGYISAKLIRVVPEGVRNEIKNNSRMMGQQFDAPPRGQN